MTKHAKVINAFREQLEEWLSPEAMFLGSTEGEFDEAIIGIVESLSGNVLVYDVDRVLACLEKQGMDRNSAIEWFDYNIASAYMGEGTPVFIRSLDNLSIKRSK